MYKKLALSIPVFLLAFTILTITLYKTSQNRYNFKYEPSPRPNPVTSINIPYELPQTGPLLPGNVLWPARPVFDKTLLTLTPNPHTKAKLHLKIANHRLATAQQLHQQEKYDLAITTIEKSEKYLQKASDYEHQARLKGFDTYQLLEELSLATLKHRESLERMAASCPEDARPMVYKFLTTPKKVFEATKIALNEKGAPIVKNPFE